MPTPTKPSVRNGLLAALLAYFITVAVGCDITGAAIVGARRGETFSHYANRHRDSWGGPVCAVLDIPDPGHCARVTYLHSGGR